jgi:thioredoxin reductase
MTETDAPRVAVVGGGPAGLTAGLFTARAGFDTVVVDDGEPILQRNAHLENVPGFPAGVSSRLFLDLLEEQAERNGCLFETGRVEDLERDDGGFELTVVSGDEAEPFVLRADYVVAASWADVDYLEGVEGVGLVDRGSKTYVDVDDDGRAGPDGLYAAGRIAQKHHQTVVVAGHGAEVALTLVDDSEVPFYHDWVAPEGYFTERGLEAPPGCEEIDEAERRRRERESMQRMLDAFEERHPEEPTMHPSVREQRQGGAEE